MTSQTYDIVRLREILTSRFSDEDLRELCFDLRVDYENLAGRQKSAKVISLITVLDQRQRLPDLVAVGRRQRRDIDWDACRAGGDVLLPAIEPAYDVTGLPNPYLGLKSFTYDERDRFAGREKVVQSAVDMLTRPGEQRSLLFITGASGSGKSSVAMAGILPALEAHYAARHKTTPRAVFRPSRRPLAVLADTLDQLGLLSLDTARLTAREADPAALFNAFVAQHTPPGQVNLLVIDQFEELFTQSDPQEKAALFAVLAGLDEFAKLHTHILATLRSDYLPDLFDVAPLYDIAKRGIDLRAMAVDELKVAIQRPVQAKVPNRRCQPTLVDRLAQDAHADATYLPLLQVTLEEIWKTGSLTLDRYGTLADAIRQRAEEVYAYTDADDPSQRQPRPAKDQAALMDILLDLVDVSPDENARRDVRRRRPRASVTRDDPKREALVDELVAARLLSAAQETDAEGQPVDTLDIIHESLIRSWDRLRAAIAENREALQARSRFEQGLAEWLRHGRSQAYLLFGVRLAEGRELEARGDVALQGDEAQELLARSIELREQEQVAQALAEVRLQRLEESERRTRLALWRHLADRSANAMEQHPDLGILLANEAYQIAQTIEASGTVLATLQRIPAFQVFVRGHSDRVNNVTFSPDGQTLASGSWDKTIILWDVSHAHQPRALGQPLAGHSAHVSSVMFSPDGQTLASGSWDKTIILWDVSNREQPRRLGQPLAGHSAHVSSVMFSPDGQTLASGSWDNTIILWDVSNREQPRRLGRSFQSRTAPINSVAFSPDGKTLASGSDGKTIILWDVSNTHQPRPLGQPLQGHSAHVSSVTFSPDGSTLASGSWDKTIILWDVSNREQPRRLGRSFQSRTTPVNSVAFSPDGKTLASGSWDKTIILWDVSNREQPRRLAQPFQGHSDAVCSVAFSPDGSTLASGSEDKTIILWDLSSQQMRTLGQPLEGHSDAVYSVAFSSDSKTLASAGGHNTIRLWDVSNMQQPCSLDPPLQGHSDGEWGVTFTSDGETIVGYLEPVHSVAFSPNGRTLASASEDRTMILWNVTNPEQPLLLGQPLKGHSDSVNSVAFSSDGKTLASGSEDKTIILWDVTNPEQPRLLGQPLKGHSDSVNSVAFSPDGKTLASGGSYDDTIILWDVTNPEQPRLLGQPLKGHSSGVNTVAFSPDGKMLASGSHDHTIILWDVSNREQPRALGQPLASHSAHVSCLSFRPDGKMLASGSRDYTIILWDVTNPEQPRALGQPLAGHSDSVNSVAFSSDGKTLASGSEDKTIILWDVDVKSWLRRACRTANRNLGLAEWNFYIGPDIPYRKTCSDLPPGEGAPEALAVRSMGPIVADQAG